MKGGNNGGVKSRREVSGSIPEESYCAQRVLKELMKKLGRTAARERERVIPIVNFNDIVVAIKAMP